MIGPRIPHLYDHLNLFVHFKLKVQSYNLVPLYQYIDSGGQIVLSFSSAITVFINSLFNSLKSAYSSSTSSMVRKSSREIALSPELLEQIVNMDAVSTGKAGNVLNYYPCKPPFELRQIRHDCIIFFFRLDRKNDKNSKPFIKDK